jgi:tryptophanase
MDYVTEFVRNVLKKREAVIGMRIAYEQPVLRHFTAISEPL